MRDEIINSPKEIGLAIKTRRKELGITQKQLADYCDLSHNGISRIEIGDSDVKLTTLLKMSSLLGFRIKLEMSE